MAIIVHILILDDNRSINEGEAGEEGADLGALAGATGEGAGDLDQPGVIQVSPQDKEAIERVKANFITKTELILFYYFS